MTHAAVNLWYRFLHIFGDCDRCGHSIVYHVPLFGCGKCSCEEFR